MITAKHKNFKKIENIIKKKLEKTSLFGFKAFEIDLIEVNQLLKNEYKRMLYTYNMFS
jgi:hypothetical protein